MIEGVQHQLAVAIRFLDAFTGTPVGVPLDVRAEKVPIVKSMPLIPWRAVRGTNDSTYRFLVSDREAMPVGPIPVTATATRADYVDFEGFSVVLPRPLVAHPPTPARSDFLIEKALWPTRVMKVPPGETAIVTMIKSVGATAVEGLRIKIWPGPGPAPVQPYTYTNASGEALFRLPDLKTVVGGVISSTATLRLDIRLPPAPYTVAVVPTQIKTDAGTVLPVPFPIRLGQVTTLEISIP